MNKKRFIAFTISVLVLALAGVTGTAAAQTTITDTWQLDTTSDLQYLDNISETGANVYSVDSDDQYVYYGSHDGNVYVHEKDASAGFPLITTLTPAGGSQVNSVDSDGERVFYATSGGEVGAYSRSDFTLDWSRQESRDVMMVDVNDTYNSTHMVYTVDGDGVYMASQSDGTVAWSSANSQDNLLDSATIGPQYVYSGEDSNAFVHDHNGNLVYEPRTNDCCMETIVPGSGDYFYISDETPEITVYRTSDGTKAYTLSPSVSGFAISSLYVDPAGQYLFANDNSNSYVFSGIPSSLTQEASWSMPNAGIDHYDTDSVYFDSEYFYFSGDNGNVSVVEVEEPQPPTASFTFSPTNPTTSDTVTFNASSSSDDGSIQTYEWDLDDGTMESGETVTHSYDNPGTYNVTLTVTDGDELIDTEALDVTVQSTQDRRDLSRGEDQDTDRRRDRSRGQSRRSDRRRNRGRGR